MMEDFALLERLRDRQDEDLNTVYAAIADAYMTSKMRQGAGEAMNRLSRRLREVNREKAKLVERLEQAERAWRDFEHHPAECPFPAGSCDCGEKWEALAAHRSPK